MWWFDSTKTKREDDEAGDDWGGHSRRLDQTWKDAKGIWRDPDEKGYLDDSGTLGYRDEYEG